MNHEVIQAAIDEHVAAAKSLMASGVKSAEVSQRIEKHLADAEELKAKIDRRKGLEDSVETLLGGGRPASESTKGMTLAGHVKRQLPPGVKSLTDAPSAYVPVAFLGLSSSRPASPAAAAIPMEPGTGGSVRFLRQVAPTLSSGIGTAPGTQKPTATFDIEPKDEPYEVLASLSPYMANSLWADEGSWGGLVDGELASDVALKLSAYVVAGLADTDALTQDFETDALTSIRKGVTKVQTGKVGIADTLVLSPADAEGLDLAQAETAGQYLLQPSGPANILDGSNPLWRLKVVVDVMQAAGSALVFDSTKAAKLVMRENATFAMDTISHFDTNESRARCELRAVIAVQRPRAICKVELVATP